MTIPHYVSISLRYAYKFESWVSTRLWTKTCFYRRGSPGANPWYLNPPEKTFSSGFLNGSGHVLTKRSACYCECPAMATHRWIPQEQIVHESQNYATQSLVFLISKIPWWFPTFYPCLLLYVIRDVPPNGILKRAIPRCQNSTDYATIQRS